MTSPSLQRTQVQRDTRAEVRRCWIHVLRVLARPDQTECGRIWVSREVRPDLVWRPAIFEPVYLTVDPRLRRRSRLRARRDYLKTWLFRKKLVVRFRDDLFIFKLKRVL